MTDVQIKPEQGDYEWIIGKMIAVEKPGLGDDARAVEVHKAIEEQDAPLPVIVDEIWKIRGTATNPAAQIDDATFDKALRAAFDKLGAAHMLSGPELDKEVATAVGDPVARVFAQAAWERAGERFGQA